LVPTLVTSELVRTLAAKPVIAFTDLSQFATYRGEVIAEFLVTEAGERRLSRETVVGALQLVLAARRAARNEDRAQRYSVARRTQPRLSNAALPVATLELCTAATC
jgi:hypothetical protein